MQRQAQVHTKPELLLRVALELRGVKHLVNQRPVAAIRRRADIVVPAPQVAVFIDGCFWHMCPQHATWPKANAEFWRAKLERNQQRDRGTDTRLASSGWAVVRIWEHENAEDAADRVYRIVEERLAKG